MQIFLKIKKLHLGCSLSYKTNYIKNNRYGTTVNKDTKKSPDIMPRLLNLKLFYNLNCWNRKA